MGAWTLTTPMVGIYRIVKHYPGIFKAIVPHHVFTFFARNGTQGWLLLSGIILCITGVEAMLADLGPFDTTSMQIAFLSTIYPSLVLTYAGQTAYLIENPNDHADGFYKSIPHTVYWPMFVVATLAAIVASQSLISAAFSIIKQSVGLDYFPRVRIIHTSTRQEREVYAPEVNYILMVICVAVILMFGNGADIGNAYGVAVNMVMLITTVLLTVVMITIWETPGILVAGFFVFFFTIEVVYLSSVLTKIPQGGWIPFAISLCLAFIMFCWIHGRKRKMQYELGHRIDRESLGMVPGIQRVPGILFFYTNIQHGLTPVFGHYLKTMRFLHRVTIFTTLRYCPVPNVSPGHKISIRKLGPQGVYECIVQYGFADSLHLNGTDDFVQALVNHGEISEAEEAKGAAHIRGKAKLHVGEDCGWFDRTMLAVYQVLDNNCRSGLPALGIPLEQITEVGMLYQVQA